MTEEQAEVLVVGAGVSGLIMGLRLKADGRSFVILEQAAEVGGTWRDNTYPGCACDVPSHLYCIASEPKADWTRAFAPQAEIQDYLTGVAARRGLYPHIRFGCAMASASWDEQGRGWRVTTEDGRVFLAQSLVLAVGALHIPALPSLPGLERFEGPAFHSARWDHRFDPAGKRIAVIGTGASAVQFTPEIAPAAGKIDVYQRTPPWVLPRRDWAIWPALRRLFGDLPALRQLYRGWLFATREFRHRLMAGNLSLARAAERIGRRHMAGPIQDRSLHRTLTPGYRIGCKRILLSDDWYPTLARDNVEVVTEAISEVRARSIVTADGVERPADALIFGTGFHAADAFDHLRVTGRGGLALSDAWKDGMSAAHGTTVPGFPNLFVLLGPNTGLGHNSVVLMIEAQVAYVRRLLDHMRRNGLAEVEVREDVLQAYAAEMQTRLASTVWQAGGCRSWYQDASGRNTTLWPGTVGEFQRRMAQVGLDAFETA